MKRLFLCLVVLLTPIVGVAQDALITFYSPGSMAHQAVKQTAEVGLPGSNPYFGWIFDGGKPIAFMNPGRFITLHYAPGDHVFSAGIDEKHPAPNARVSMSSRSTGDSSRRQPAQTRWQRLEKPSQ